MSHILEGLDQSPPQAKSVDTSPSEAYSNEPEGSQNGRPHFERFPMRIVMIPVHGDVPEPVRNRSPPSWARWVMDSRSILSPSTLSPSPHQPQPTSTSPPLTSYRIPSTLAQSEPWMGWETSACKLRYTGCTTSPISGWKCSIGALPCKKRHASSASIGRTSTLWKRAWTERRWRSRSASKQHKYS